MTVIVQHLANFNDMSNIKELRPKQPSRWVRKCLRSKRMTRWFLTPRIFRLRALSGAAAEGSRALVQEWVPACGPSTTQPTATVGNVAVVSMARPREIGHPGVTYRVLHDVSIHSLSDLIYVGGDALLGDLVQLDCDKLPEEYRPGVKVDVVQRKISLPHVPEGRHSLPEAVSMLDATAPNYAHWLTEILPKAVLWSRFGHSSEVPLLVDAGLHPNILRSLTLVSPVEQRVLLVPKHQVVDVRTLHHISSPGHIPFEPRPDDALPRSHGVFSGPALRMMVAAVKSALRLSDSDPQDDVVYIRRNSGVRNVVNQAELDELAAQQGWRVVEPERLTFDEQVQVFHGARMVIGPTGAAMANLLFARPGCRVAVMMSTHRATPYFYWHNMAEPLGVKVEYILCKPEDEGPRAVHSNFSAPMADVIRVYSKVTP